MKNRFNLTSFKITLLAFAFFAASSIAEAQQPQNNPPNGQSPTAIRRGGRAVGNNANNNNNNNAKSAPQNKGVNQNPSGTAPAIPFDKSPNGLNFQDAAADLLIMDYAMRTGRLVVKDPATPTPLITLRSTPESPLTDEEYLLAIESVLNLNGIALEKDGEKFLKVFPSSEFHRRGIKGDIVSDVTKKEALLPEDGRFVTRTIRLNYISIEEAKAIVEGFVRTGSQIQTFERDNSFRITDSVENVNRIIEMFSHLDKPIPALEETNIIKIQYAKATEIKERLMEIVTDAQEDQEKNKSAATERTSGAPGTYHRPLPPGAGVPGNRWNRNQPNQQQDNKAAGNAAIDAAVADAQRGLIRGKVSIFADERTNILIIITRKENMVFFNKLIEELDIATAPDVLAEVIRLEHAVAEEVAELLNELIDNANNDSNDSKVRRNENANSNNNNNQQNNRPQSTTTRNRATSGINSQMVGQLDSENIKILADERTNSLLIMSPAADMAVIKNIIKDVDIQLSQVVIEAAIVSVKFTDSLETGMDWVQRTMLSGENIAFATSGGGGTGKATPALNFSTDASGLAGSGINLATTLFDLNLDVILKAVKTDSRSRLLSSPRITTLDNKEAVLTETERIYWNEGTTYYDDSNRSSDNVKSEDIGIKLTVTPRINKNGFINLTIEQEMQTNEGYKPIATGNNTSEYPMLNTRKMGADVAVQSGETVVLGGLAQNQVTIAQTKVPILGSIPLIGWLFRSEKEENTRTEIIVFITPRVINTPAQIEDDARKVRATLDTEGVWDSGWSYSRLADPKKEKEREKYIDNSRKTVEKPKTPLSGYLTNTNEENGFDNPVKGEKNPDGSNTDYPYIHFTEVENLRELPNGVVLPKEEKAEIDSIQKEVEEIEKFKEVEEVKEISAPVDSAKKNLDESIDAIIKAGSENNLGK